jgi:hypothetical protein
MSIRELDYFGEGNSVMSFLQPSLSSKEIEGYIVIEGVEWIESFGVI